MVLNGADIVSLGEIAPEAQMKNLPTLLEYEYESAVDSLSEFLDCNEQQLEDLRECLRQVNDDIATELGDVPDEYTPYDEIVDIFCDIQVFAAEKDNGCTSICPLVDGFDCAELPPEETVEAFCDFSTEDLCEIAFEDAIKEANAGEIIKYSSVLSAAITIVAAYLF